MMYT